MKKLFLLFLILSLSLNATQSREDLEKTTTYVLLNRLLFLGCIASLSYAAYTYFSQEEEDKEPLLTVTNATNTACSIFFSACLSKISRKLPPLTSFLGNKKSNERMSTRDELEGFGLWVQDQLALCSMNYLADSLVRLVQFPSAQAQGINMEHWCQEFAHGNLTLRAASTELSVSHETAVNLMFVPKINQSLANNEYIGGLSKENLLKNIIFSVINWSEKCRDCDINLWLDRAMENDEALKNTMHTLCEAFHARNISLSNVAVQNLRDLPQMNDNQHLFTANVYLYLKLDILRMLVSSFLLEKGYAFSLYSDLDLVAFPLDKEIKTALLKAPFLLVSGEDKGFHFENGLFIFTPEAKEMIDTCFLAPAYRILNFLSSFNLPLEVQEAYEDGIYMINYLLCACYNTDNERLTFIPRYAFIKAVRKYEESPALDMRPFIEVANRNTKIFLSDFFHRKNLTTLSPEEMMALSGFLQKIDNQLLFSMCPTHEFPTDITVKRIAYE
jgi:hypothetical protein